MWSSILSNVIPSLWRQSCSSVKSIDCWRSCPCFCWMNTPGSSVEAIRKASTHWTEEPKIWRSDSAFFLKGHSRLMCLQERTEEYRRCYIKAKKLTKPLSKTDWRGIYKTGLNSMKIGKVKWIKKDCIAQRWLLPDSTPFRTGRIRRNGQQTVRLILI